VCALAKIDRAIERLVATVNQRRATRNVIEPFAWKRNALRHSFISYRVAKINNVAQVALEAGNSTNIVFRNYRQLVKPRQAEAWFAIIPPAGEKIITLDRAA
jgi:hypothetical protein